MNELVPPVYSLAAVLVDADNVSFAHAQKLTQHLRCVAGETLYHVFAGMSDPAKGPAARWTRALQDRGVEGFEVSAGLSGKNAADLAIIIKAMDLLHQRPVELFVFVTNDGHLAQLAERLQEAGKTVLLFAYANASKRLKNQCRQVVQLEPKQKQATAKGVKEVAGGCVPDPRLTDAVREQVRQTIAACETPGHHLPLAVLGKQLTQQWGAYRTNRFGFASLSKLLTMLGYQVEVVDGAAVLSFFPGQAEGVFPGRLDAANRARSD